MPRSYTVCPTCQVGFFPLDEELALLPGQLTPSLQESLVRLGMWMPCVRAAAALHFFTRVQVSEPAVRRGTEAAGAAYEAVPTAAVEDTEQQPPLVPAGPPIQLLSVDGAMVPLWHKAWAAVKTLASGTVGEAVRERGERGERGSSPGNSRIFRG